MKNKSVFIRFARRTWIPAIMIAGISASFMASRQGNPDIAKPYLVPTAKGTIEITPMSEDIFKISVLPDDTSMEELKSQAAVMIPGNVKVSLTMTPDSAILSTKSTTLKVSNRSGNIAFYKANGEKLMEEAGGVDNSTHKVTLLSTGNSHFYGAGERGHRPTLNGDTLTMFNRQNYGYGSGDPRISQMGISVPYYASDKGYGVLFDDYCRAKLVLGDTVTYTSETPAKLSYYFINGKGTLAGVTEGLTELTGRQNLPPFWALGYITSKYGYKTQAETLGVIDTLKNKGYPVDGIVLDLYWYGQETDMGRLEWNKDQWPDHKKMLSELKEKGVNTVLISQPYINKIGAIDNYNMLAANGMLVTDSEGNVHDVTTWVGDAGMFDVSNPKTRNWLWNRYKSLTEEGVAGWWGDLGEPEVHPLTIVHHNGQTAAQYHNVYGNEWSRIIYEGLRQDFPDQRPLLMMRGGTTGLQRYSVFPWTTDVARSWKGMQPQINLMLSAGLSGIAYMSSDLGGFAVDEKNPLDPELYVRWVYMGAFTPSFRTHAQLKPEPYNYPEYETILKKIVKSRYEWLPYNYTLAYENTSKGLPLARPLNFYGENNDDKYTSIDNEYLWGDNVLIAPVMQKGAKSRKVTFPAGEWINWNNTRLTYKGGITSIVAAPLSELPMFVRAGSFIPQYLQSIENTSQYDPKFLTVKYFPSTEESSYTMFDDDRKSPNSLENGSFQLTTFTGKQDTDSITINIKADGAGYDNMPDFRMLTFEIETIKAAPTSVESSSGIPLPKCDSQKAIRQSGWAFDADKRLLTVRLPYEYTNEKLTINFKK
jgi:alpha-glucosidase (family GH31 glycosyl hydrolase)